MNNGQLNTVSVSTVTQLVTQKSAAPAAALDGTQQTGGDFAGLLSGVQLLAKENTVPERHAPQLLPKTVKDQVPSDAAENSGVQNYVSPVIIALPESAGPQTKNPEEPDANSDAAPLRSELPDVASRMVMAAYSQPGRMPEVNLLTPLPVDTLQNVAAATEQPTVNTAPAVKISAGQVAAMPQKTSVVSDENFYLQSQPQTTLGDSGTQAVRMERPVDKISGANKLTQSLVDSVQNAVTEKERSEITAAPADKIHLAQIAAEPSGSETLLKPASSLVDSGAREIPRVQPPPESDVIKPVLATLLTATPLQQELSGRKVDAITPAKLPVGTLQNAVDPAASRPAGIFTALSEKTAAPPVVAVPIQTAQEQTSVSLPESLAAATVLRQPETSSSQPITTVSTVPLESELDIQLSQPRPVTVRATTAAALADSRAASLLQEPRGVRQRHTSEQQNERGRAGVELGIVKEASPLLQTALSASEATFGSSTSEGDSNQNLPDGTAARNQAQAQDMQGQLSGEHQKVSVVTNKSVSTEPARQAIPEQVMQQVKERLVLHEVKAGNQQITLTLSPDSLGELKMNLNLQGQKLSIEIITESRSVRDAIVLHTDALKESLARQNITMDSFDVTTGGKGSGNQGPNQNAWRELTKQQQQEQLWASPRGYTTVQADLPTGQGAYPKQQGHSMLDIHY